MRILIYPYAVTSQSAKRLSTHSGWPRMKRQGSSAKPKDTLLINWGSAALPKGFKALNAHTGIASNKTQAFIALTKAGVKVPKYTASKDDAKEWLQKGERVFARKLLSSHSGKGIVNLKGDVEVPDAPLYVQYVQKNAEFRVHATKDKAFLVQQKRQREGVEPKDKFIRSWHNGYVFVKNNVEEAPGIHELAVASVRACGLDFGAVDIIRGKKDGELYVLEVNTAPGVDNMQAKVYTEALGGLINA